MRAVIYARASLDRTGEGKSTDRQTEECQRLIAYKRWETVLVDGKPSAEDISISAYGDKERPAWLRVLAMVEAGEVDVVVAYHLDRLTRNMADLEKLILVCERHNVLVATATGDIDLTNDTGRMVARILAAVARQEVERKAARQRLAHVQRRAEGKPWAGTKMLGYTRRGEIIEEEAAAIREAMEDVIEKRASLAELGRRWHALGLESPYKATDKAWSPRGVKGILTNPRLAGFITQDGVVLGKGQWEPIVDETLLTLVIATLSAPSRTNGKDKRGRTAQNLLSGIMACSKCRSTVRAGIKRGEETYVCDKWHVTVNRAEADALVRSAFASAVALTRPGAIVEGRSHAVDPESVEAEIESLLAKQETLVQAFVAGGLTGELFERANGAISEQIKAQQAKASHAGSEIDWLKLRGESVTNFLGMDMEAQRKVLQRLATIRVHPADRKNPGAAQQIEVLVKGRRGEQDIEIPAHIPDQLKVS